MQTRLGRRTGECGTLLIYSFPRETTVRRPQRIKGRMKQNLKLEYEINGMGQSQITKRNHNMQSR